MYSESNMIKSEELFHIGRLAKPHGVKGEIALQAEYDIAAVLDDDAVDDRYLVCNMDEIWTPFFLTSFRRKSNTTYLVKFDNTDTEEKVRSLVGKAVYIPLNKLPEQITDAPCSVVGYTIVDAEREVTGRVEAIDDSTPNVILQVVADGKELLIPTAFVTNVNHTDKTLAIALPDGFLNI
jgi:16S rRNA processing protein RimM